MSHAKILPWQRVVQLTMATGVFPAYQKNMEVRKRNKPWALSIQPNLLKFGNSGKWYRHFAEKFPEITETVEFAKLRITKPKILEIPGAKLNGKKTFGKKFPKIWVHLARLASLSLEILENTVPFTTGSCLKFKLDVLVEWKAPLDHMEFLISCTLRPSTCH